MLFRSIGIQRPLMGRLLWYGAPNGLQLVVEVAAFTALHDALGAFEGQDATAEDLQTAVFTVGKGANYENLREWFQALYQVLLGQDQGPRFGSFIALYGVAETRALLMQGIKGELAA